MKVSVKQYAQVLLEITRDKKEKDLSQIIDSFAKLLISHNQTAKIDKIIDYFSLLWNRENNFVKANIKSANKLSQDLLDSLEKYIKKASQGETIEIETEIDKNLLGGVIIKYNDYIFDASLRTKLRDLKNSLIN